MRNARKVFLDSPLGNKLISGAQQGMTIMNISYKDLATLEIPIPPIVEQEKVAEEYSKELDKYKRAIREAEERWDAVVKRLQMF